ncbi:MAG: hypothetical protein FWE44_04300 [Defluviitaleaceae bacterium]|nr:hypothetical protein [Defluviitaleaceae bacterium]
MKFKTTPFQSMLIIPWVVNVGFAIFFFVNASWVHGLLVAVPAVLILGYILLESARAGYIFKEQGLVWKSAFGREEVVRYETIKKVHKTPAFFGGSTKRPRITLDIGKNVPYTLNLKDPAGFLEELHKHVGELEVIRREL